MDSNLKLMRVGKPSSRGEYVMTGVGARSLIVADDADDRKIFLRTKLQRDINIIRVSTT